MKREITVLPAAMDEVTEASEWYEARDAGLGARFLEAFDRAQDRIEDAPGACSPMAEHRLARRAPVGGRFPFHVVFVE